MSQLLYLSTFTPTQSSLSIIETVDANGSVMFVIENTKDITTHTFKTISDVLNFITQISLTCNSDEEDLLNDIEEIIIFFHKEGWGFNGKTTLCRC